jgi:hypothetical protein
MPYVPKSVAPATFSLGQAFGALVAGDLSLSWLSSFIPLVQDVMIDTAALCANGPPPDPSVPTGFQPMIPGLRGSIPTNYLVYITERIQQVALARVFGAYCELQTTTAGVCFEFHGEIHGGGNTTIGSGDLPSTGDLGYTVQTYWAGGNDKALIGFQYDPGSGVWADIFNDGNYENGWPTGNTTTGGLVGSSSWWGKPWRLVVNTPGTDANRVGLNFTWSGDCAGTAPYVPTPQPEPPGFIGPPALDYPDLPAVGKELDRQELKLDAILSFLMQSNIIIPPLGPPEPLPDPTDIAPITPDDPAVKVPLPKGALAIIVTLSSWPARVSEGYTPPKHLYRVGRAIFNGFGADGPVVQIELSVQRIPIPPNTDSFYISLEPGVSGSYQIVMPPKSV